MAHYKLILAYEGTHYAGFQRQAHKETVQSTVEDALRNLGWTGRAIMAAGRTDSGVHALGQVISFNFDWKHGEHKLLKALNANLPSDIAVQNVAEVPYAFHPRYDALRREYRYRLYFQGQRDPLRDAFAWRLDRAPSLCQMNEAAQAMIGEWDFRAFGRALKEDGSTKRELFEAKWQTVGDEQHFTIIGNAFLYHMVRRIVYVLVKIGLGELPLETIKIGLTEGETGIVSLAPARGLCMMKVEYPLEVFSEDRNENEFPDEVPGESRKRRK